MQGPYYGTICDGCSRCLLRGIVRVGGKNLCLKCRRRLANTKTNA